MATIHLQVDDDFIDDFLKTLPLDKVKVLDKNFLSNQTKLHEELDKFLTKKSNFTPYHENMNKISTWLEQGGNSENS